MNEIFSIANLARAAALNTKLNEIKIKIPDITNLAITTVLTAIENKILDYRKHITTTDVNKLTVENFAARLVGTDLPSKNRGTAKIISYLDPNKTQDHDMLNTQMIKLRGNLIYKPLSVIFNDCLNEEKFPHEWKKSNVEPVR